MLADQWASAAALATLLRTFALLCSGVPTGERPAHSVAEVTLPARVIGFDGQALFTGL